MVGHTVVAWCWLREAAAARAALDGASGDDDAFYRGKLSAARFFYKHELPKTETQAKLIQCFDTSTLEMNAAYF